MSDMLPIERIENRILLIRGKKVLLDRDIAELYGVQTKALKQAVRRNIARFPVDFMFELTKDEFSNWRSQFVTSNADNMGLRYAPMAFTEHGVAMLATVLKSEKAIHMSVTIIRAFIKMREMLLANEQMAERVKELEERIGTQEFNTIIIMDKLRTLSTPEEKKMAKIGFNINSKKQDDK